MASTMNKAKPVKKGKVTPKSPTQKSLNTKISKKKGEIDLYDKNIGEIEAIISDKKNPLTPAQKTVHLNHIDKMARKKAVVKADIDDLIQQLESLPIK